MGLIDWIGKGAEDFLEGFFYTKSSDAYSAAFGNASHYLSEDNEGFNLTGFRNGRLDAETSKKHVLLAAPSGSGKSTACIISSIQDMSQEGSSFLIQDSSGELWILLSGFLRQRGYELIQINFCSSNSAAFNPLLQCESFGDVGRLMQLLYKNAIKNGNQDFWELAACSLMTLCGRYIRFYCEPQYCTMQNILITIQSFGAGEYDALDQMFARCNELYLSYKAFVSVNESTRQSIIASATAAFALWQDPNICAVTGNNTFSFSSLKATPCAIFLSSPMKYLTYVAPATAVILSSCFDYLLSNPHKAGDRNIYVILDEFSTVTFPGFGDIICNLRKAAGLLIALQELQSLVHTYGQATADVIFANTSTKIFYPPVSYKTSEMVSRMLGYTTFEDEEGRKQKVELQTIDQVRMSTDAFIFIGSAPPLKVVIQPFFKSRRRRKLCSIAPPEDINITLPTLPILNISHEEQI